MCTGKSTVGRLVAERLGWEFVDFDSAIEATQNQTITEIFREHGEPFFRALEAKMTAEVADRWRVVLATGGGWVTHPELVDRLKPRSLIIWLRARPETVYERHRGQADVVRPLLETDRPLDVIRATLGERAPLYEQADAAVDTDAREPEEIAHHIATMVGQS